VRVGAHQHTRIGYDRDTERLFVDRSSSGAPVDPSFGGVQSAPAALSADGALHLRIIVDHSSVEVFTADGQVAITDQIYPDASSDAVRLFADDGDVTLTSARLTPLGADAR
jgi:sucrose-6-phosphate hydrolase SacC (GH32 family)